MSTIGAAHRFDPPPLAVHAQPVEPVRPVVGRTERQSERGENTATAHRFALRDRSPQPANVDAAQLREPQQPATVVAFPQRARPALPYAPFLAQQIAQENEPDVESLDDRASRAAAAAYRQAAGDSDIVLGFVRPLRISI